MGDSKLVRRWQAAFALAGAVVGVAATLLLTIIGIGRSIAGNAQRTQAAVDGIYGNTCPIWELDATNAAAAQILAEVQAIERNALKVADALERTA